MALTALTNPPAPYSLIYGVVRNMCGAPLTNANAQIVLASPGKPALAAGAPLSIYAVIKHVTNLPIETTVNSPTLGHPARSARIKLTLGGGREQFRFPQRRGTLQRDHPARQS